MLKLRKNKKGFLLLEAVLMLAVMTALAFGMMTIMVGNFGTLSAAQEANQAQQVAEYIASMLRQDGYENVEDFDMQETPTSANEFVGDSTDLHDKYLYTVKKLSDFNAKGDPYNKVKLMEVKIYPEGHSDVPLYTLQVPLSSQAWAIPVGSVIAWPSSETPTSGGVWLECNGQSIPSEYRRLRELVGSHTPDYQGVFLRGYGSQSGTIKPTYPWANMMNENNQTFHSGALGELVTDATRDTKGNLHGVITSYYDSAELYNYFFRESLHIPNLGWGEWYLVPFDDNNFDVVNETGAFCADSADIFAPWWIATRPPKKYRLEGGGGGGGEEGGGGSTYTLVEEEDTEGGEYRNFMRVGWTNWNALQMQVDDEIRPVNKAVRYFIKAR